MGRAPAVSHASSPGFLDHVLAAFGAEESDSLEAVALIAFHERSAHAGRTGDAVSAAAVEAVRAEEGGPRRQLTSPALGPLSERELEVLQLICDGASNHDIARQLVIALGTVKRHVSNIFLKLGARSRTQAIAHARRLVGADERIGRG
jgi:ATP/maltotriose-dependent transcriptional regulator MalT